MKKKLCPKCKIASLFIKNSNDERHSIYVDENLTIISKAGFTLEALRAMNYDLEQIYCYGCSWSGKLSELKNY